MSHAGRRPGESGTREAILEAARRAFGERGYERASIRAIAGRAGVDPALVHHYFRTKDQLLMAAIALPADPAAVLAIVARDPDRLGWNLARHVLALWDAPEARDRIAGLVRSAVSHERATAALRALITREILGPLARALELPDADLRAALAGSQLVGLAMARYVVGIEPLASLPAERIVAAIGPTIQRYLTGDIGAGGGRSRPGRGAQRTLKDAAPPSRRISARSSAASKSGEA